MLVFISWSGQRSKVIAEGLKTWLGQVIQSLDPWISTDIDKGKRWDPEIAGRLEKSRVGIICLTKDNIDNKWILFEAGAISKSKDAYVCTLLLDLKPSDVEPPLGSFQHTAINKEDVKKMLNTINDVMGKIPGEKALDNTVLDSVFETYWPQLQKVFSSALAIKKTDEKPGRSEKEILEEILEIVRHRDNKISYQFEPQNWDSPQIVHLSDSQRVPPFAWLPPTLRVESEENKGRVSLTSNNSQDAKLLNLGTTIPTPKK